MKRNSKTLWVLFGRLRVLYNNTLYQLGRRMTDPDMQNQGSDALITWQEQQSNIFLCASVLQSLRTGQALLSMAALSMTASSQALAC